MMNDALRDTLIKNLHVVRKQIADATLPQEKERLIREALTLRRKLAEIDNQYSGNDTKDGEMNDQLDTEALTARLQKMSHRISDMERLEVDLKNTLENLWKSESLFKTVLSNAPVVIFALDDRGVFLSSEGKGMDALGLKSKDIIGKSAFDIYGDLPHFLRDISRALSGHAFTSTISTSGMWFETRYEPVQNSARNGVRVIGISIDVTRQKQLEEEHRALTITDELTGLLNRRGFFNVAPQQFKMANREKRRLFLLYCDIDNLKHINDTFGHTEGDNAIVQVAELFRSTFRESDIIARIGGDEFVVLMLEQTWEESDIEIENRLLMRLDELNRGEKRGYVLSLSCGTGHYDFNNPCSLEHMLVEADAEMYRNKKDE
jgi:diguanylate cyclase (GGDEF)-like protein/PAS domain S-box-containing protein